MSFLDRFFGRRQNPDPGPSALVANPNLEDARSLQLLFERARPIDAADLEQALRSIDRSLKHARCEIDDDQSRDGTLVGSAGWGRHVIRFVGFAAPMPADTLEPSLEGAHYPAELKARARMHGAHMRLDYVGYDTAPLEQYVALAVVAAVLGKQGALVVLNESARTSLPSQALEDIAAHAKALAMFHELPLPYLYCGFVKHEVEGVPGIWMRTYGAPRLGLPDLAAHATGHHEGQRHFDHFENVLRYILSSGAHVARGHTMQIGTDYVRLRAPKLDESFLVRDGELFVLEPIEADEVNR